MKAAMSEMISEMIKTPEGRKELQDKGLCNPSMGGGGEPVVVELGGKKYRVTTSEVSRGNGEGR
jgi:hypothetical protein